MSQVSVRVQAAAPANLEPSASDALHGVPSRCSASFRNACSGPGDDLAADVAADVLEPLPDEATGAGPLPGGVKLLYSIKSPSLSFT